LYALEEMLPIITLSRRMNQGKTGIFAIATLEYCWDFPCPGCAIFEGKYRDLP
jgi:hypothetical protein